MSAIRFEWDSGKAAANLRKHGVAFEEARTVLEDDEALFMPDPEHSVREERFVLVGVSAALRVIVVVHYECDDGDVIRITFMKAATAQSNVRRTGNAGTPEGAGGRDRRRGLDERGGRCLSALPDVW